MLHFTEATLRHTVHCIYAVPSLGGPAGDAPLWAQGQKEMCPPEQLGLGFCLRCELTLCPPLGSQQAQSWPPACCALLPLPQYLHLLTF